MDVLSVDEQKLLKSLLVGLMSSGNFSCIAGMNTAGINLSMVASMAPSLYRLVYPESNKLHADQHIERLKVKLDSFETEAHSRIRDLERLVRDLHDLKDELQIRAELKSQDDNQWGTF
jgi:hypothetical protein